jgi:hypothetical protein
MAFCENVKYPLQVKRIVALELLSGISDTEHEIKVAHSVMPKMACE